MEQLESAISFCLPAIIKAESDNGRRLVTVEASNEAVDAEGDVILQSALMGSAKSFVDAGHLDIDHFSEIGHRIGITNPEWYIVGNPLGVDDGGDGRTFVRGELRRASDGSFDARRPYDNLWDQLTSTPPVRWYASIFGYPISSKTEDCREHDCESGATRYLIKGIRWTSLAFTRRPVNQALTGNARVMTAKALIKSFLAKSPDMDYTEASGVDKLREPRNQSPQGVPEPLEESMPGGPISLADVHMGHVDSALKCQKCGPILRAMPSIPGFRNHFMKCAGMPVGMADIAAHAGFAKSIMGYYP